MAICGRAVLLVAAALMIASALGCSRSPGSAPKRTATAPVATVNPYVATLAARPDIATALAKETQTAATRWDDLFCTVDLPESWRSALAQGRISVPDTVRLYTTAVAADGSRVFGALYSAAWSGVVAVDRQGSITRIRAFDNPQEDSISAAFDGRWLVWSERHSPENLAAGDIRAWDSTTGEVFDIFSAPVVGGTPVWQLSAATPVVSQGQVAWVRYRGDLYAPYELHLCSLAERRDRVVSDVKQVSPIRFWGSKLLLSERDTPDSEGHFAMVDAVTGAPSAVPELFAAIPYAAYVAASGDLMAWSDGTSVFIWRPGEPKATRIFAAGRGGQVDWITTAGDLVEWESLKGPMAADLRSHSIAPLTGGNGFAYTNGNALLVSQPVGPLVKSADPLTGNVEEDDVVDVTKLPPLPGCPS